MPEGDTVWLTAHRLDAALAGRVLTVADLRVPELATTDLTGAAVTGVLARGKHILTRLDTGLTLHSHLRMDGSWHLSRAGVRPRRHPEHMIRALLGNGDWLATGYRVHDLALVPTGREDDLVGHLGPDLLGPDWDADRGPGQPAPRAGGHDRRGAARPAQPRRHRQHVQVRGAVRRAGSIRGRRSAGVDRLPEVDRDGPPAPAGQPRPPRAVDHRARRPRPGALGLRPARRAVPALPDPDRATPSRARRPTQRATFWCPRCQPAAQAEAVGDRASLAPATSGSAATSTARSRGDASPGGPG